MKKALERLGKTLTGDTSNFTGDVSGLSGYVSGLSGYVTGLTGYVDSCDLTDEDRQRGVNIRDLVAEAAV